MTKQSQWRGHVEARRKLSLAPNAQIDLIPVEVTPSAAPLTATETSLVLRFTGGAQLEFSTAVSPRWLAELQQCQR